MLHRASIDGRFKELEMITNYAVPRLTPQTSDRAREKLIRALKGVSGVEFVTLKPRSHQVEIEGTDRQEPNAAEISEAATAAGFTFASLSK
jgi:hypothetical protein